MPKPTKLSAKQKHARRKAARQSHKTSANGKSSGNLRTLLRNAIQDPLKLDEISRATGIKPTKLFRMANNPQPIHAGLRETMEAMLK